MPGTLISVDFSLPLRDFDPLTRGPKEVGMIHSNAGIVVIDDDASIRESLLFLIDSQPSQVWAFESLSQAYEMAEFQRSSVGLIFLDDNLGPNVSGFAAVGALREAFPRASVIMMGALLAQRPQAAYHAAGVAGTIIKPWNVAEIFTMLRLYLP